MLSARMRVCRRCVLLRSLRRSRRMPTIRVDSEVYEMLKNCAVSEGQPLTSPNNVLRHKLGLDRELRPSRVGRPAANRR